MDRTIGSGIRNQNIIVSYFPDYDAVCLTFRSDFITFNQFWSREGRDAFLNALEQYNEDFIQRNLSYRGTRATRQRYGVVEGFLVWQAARFTVRAYANMDVHLGYSMRRIDGNRAAFFTVTQGRAEYIDPISRDQNRTSNIMTMYFTRTQAGTLADFFDPVFLSTVIQERRGERAPALSDVDFFD
jgi:hypothetical protein